MARNLEHLADGLGGRRRVVMVDGVWGRSAQDPGLASEKETTNTSGVWRSTWVVEMDQGVHVFACDFGEGGLSSDTNIL